MTNNQIKASETHQAAQWFFLVLTQPLHCVSCIPIWFDKFLCGRETATSCFGVDERKISWHNFAQSGKGKCWNKDDDWKTWWCAFLLLFCALSSREKNDGGTTSPRNPKIWKINSVDLFTLSILTEIVKTDSIRCYDSIWYYLFFAGANFCLDWGEGVGLSLARRDYTRPRREPFGEGRLRRLRPPYGASSSHLHWPNIG